MNDLPQTICFSIKKGKSELPLIESKIREIDYRKRVKSWNHLWAEARVDLDVVLSYTKRELSKDFTSKTIFYDIIINIPNLHKIIAKYVYSTNWNFNCWEVNGNSYDENYSIYAILALANSSNELISEANSSDRLISEANNLPANIVNNLCLFGRNENQCRYLSNNNKKFSCCKINPELKTIIDDQIKSYNKTLNHPDNKLPYAINCNGYGNCSISQVEITEILEAT